MTPGIFWTLLMIMFTIGEVATVGLTSIWFALGALVTIVAVGLGAGYTMQAVVFLATTGLSMMMLRPMVQKYLKPNRHATNADRLVGTMAVVTETIDNISNIGAVQVHGQYWSAHSAHDVIIPAESKVKILEIKGVKLVVELVA